MRHSYGFVHVFTGVIVIITRACAHVPMWATVAPLVQLGTAQVNQALTLITVQYERGVYGVVAG